MTAGLKQAWWPFLLLLAGLVITHVAVQASPQPDSLIIDSTAQRVWLKDTLSYYRDSTQQLPFEAIRAAERRGEFHSVPGLAVPIGTLSVEPIWIHFAVRYPADSPAIWWLLLTPDILPSITVYAEQADGRFAIHQGGNALLFEQREMPGVGHAFKLGQDPGGVRHYFLNPCAFLPNHLKLMR